ncbi:extensin family protein [Sphingomonas sp. Leaf339]|uniref:extensin family protein n=1 Tax=Sphingomonas sp. Leaf339 TaxID=1736343 RepID=UPI0009EA553C
MSDTSGEEQLLEFLYACRNVVGSPRNSGRRSGHAQANAVDVGGLTLKDGRR